MALSMNEIKDLETMYKQLHPSKTIESISDFMFKVNRVMLNNEIIGSACSHSRKASVIGAYRLIRCYDYARFQIGIIQYFIQHESSA